MKVGPKVQTEARSITKTTILFTSVGKNAVVATNYKTKQKSLFQMKTDH